MNNAVPEAIVLDQLSDRAQVLFRYLVERYIADGQPVGSRTLARDTGLDVSPATIRNVMADLEDMGLITSPHTSAGRVPTVQGYRLFVDAMMQLRQVAEEDVARLSDDIHATPDLKSLMERTSTALSDVTQLAGLVMVPRPDVGALKQVEFLPISEGRLLVVLVMRTGEVRNAVIRPGRDFSPDELRTASEYLNNALQNADFDSVKGNLRREMSATKDEMDRIMRALVELTEAALHTEDDGDYVLAGQTKLMDFNELSDVDRLRGLFEAFNRKRDILHLLEQTVSGTGVQIFIGEESGYDLFEDLSVVASPYGDEDRILGVLAVIGPTRMPYERVVSVVDVTARLLSAALKSSD